MGWGGGKEIWLLEPKKLLTPGLSTTVVNRVKQTPGAEITKGQGVVGRC